jgi:hypothetical protein
LVSETNSIPTLEIPTHNHPTRFAVRCPAAAMESLSPESRALYDLLKTESAEIYESKFMACKKEIIDAVLASLDDTNNQIKDLNATVATAQY